MYRFVMNERYCKLLFAINVPKAQNILQLSRESNMTSSHLSTVMKQFEKENLINKVPKGREFDIVLTEKGKKLVNIVKAYDDLYKNVNIELDNEATIGGEEN